MCAPSVSSVTKDHPLSFSPAPYQKTCVTTTESSFGVHVQIEAPPARWQPVAAAPIVCLDFPYLTLFSCFCNYILFVSVTEVTGYAAIIRIIID